MREGSQVYSAVLAAVFLTLAVALLACGQFTGENTPEVSEDGSWYPPFTHGDTLVEQKIAYSDTIVRATMASFSSEVVVDADGKHWVAMKFNLNVSEYLKGTGPSSIVAVWVDGWLWDTSAEANDWKATILAQRDAQWDNREAVFFLEGSASGLGKALDRQLERADHFILSVGDPYAHDDRYSLHSRGPRLWLPTVSESAAAGESPDMDDRAYLLAVPRGPPGPSGINRTTPTITLGNLKKLIVEVAAELNGGDGSAAYQECVKSKYQFEREIRYYHQLDGRTSYANEVEHSELVSGEPAGSVVHQRQNYGHYPSDRAKTWFEGSNTGLFSIAQGDTTPYDIDGDGKFTAVVDGIEFTETFTASRPLPTGEYKVNRKEVWAIFLPCNYVLSYDWTVTVTAPAGTLHELFFDPVTVGSAVAADAANGTLKPTAFTGAGGASATIGRVAYESGQVKIKVTPVTALASQVVEVIELDGTGSLSLSVADATVDTANNTLSWTVSSQPWEDGDKLMVRIHDGSAAVPTP